MSLFGICQAKIIWFRTSEENRTLLKEKGYGDGIMDKATRNKLFTTLQIIFNKLISFV